MNEISTQARTKLNEHRFDIFSQGVIDRPAQKGPFRVKLEEGTTRV